MYTHLILHIHSLGIIFFIISPPLAFSGRFLNERASEREERGINRERKFNFDESA
jgi:hypothetical protein